MKYIVGIDEAGRGPLAGPVAVGVCVMQKKFCDKVTEIFPHLRDSKKLSEKKREEFFEKMKILKRDGELNFAVALVSAKLIDEKGISYAIRSGIEGCLKKLNLNPSECEVRLDGGLKAPIEFQNQKTIIKGDESEPTISLASIVAKVTRDRYMMKLALEYPGFGFEVHKGYGTVLHRKIISEKGVCKIHRISFCRNID